MSEQSRKTTTITKLTKKSKRKFRFSQELKNNWPGITEQQWQRLENDEAFRDGLYLALVNCIAKLDRLTKEAAARRTRYSFLDPHEKSG